ncbi:MAG TPA: DUF4430 domain-containing protein [Candidatus Saccharimonadales bacterium]|nr:DUF4430 domain-containing protein [Candidatus Saccharimonadales bacterium]
MWSKQNKLIAFIIIVIVAVGIFVWKATDNNNNQGQQNQTAVQKNKSQVSYEGVQGQTALALLKAKYEVKTKSFKGLGEQVTSINGVKPDSKHFWAFYVNDKLASVGASSYKTKKNDTITWKLEAIQ